MHFTYNGVTDDGPTLVLIHGAGGSHLDYAIPWRNITAIPEPGKTRAPGQGGHVLQQRPVYAVDLPGHGDSGGESAPDVATYAEAVAAFLSQHDLRDVCLVGHSMGAAIAVATALHEPARLHSLCLIGGGAKMHVSQDLLDGLATQTDATVAAISRACWHKSTMPMYREVVRRRMTTSGAEVLVNDFTACARVDLRERLAEIEVPVLLLAAVEDRMVPLKDVEAMQSAFPNATLAPLEGCGHFLHFERSEEAAEALDGFLTKA
ncbi:MAG: alpha/beta fold hydrolase [Pseudomonadota bacterium]